MPGGNYYILLLFWYSKAEITGGGAPRLAGVKLLSCDATVCITRHGTRPGDTQEHARTQAGQLSQEDTIRDLCRTEENKPGTFFRIQPVGRGALSERCPESYLRAASCLVPKKRSKFTHMQDLGT